jgi:hypothetical protein
MKRFLVILWAVALVFGIVGTSSAIVFNGHDYVIVTYQGSSWDEATNHMLTTLGSDYHLATITSQEEQNFIESLITYGTEFWLGGFQSPNQPDKDAGWQWVNGEGTFWDNATTGMYANWNEGEANDHYGVGSEQYLGIWGGFKGLTWNDEGNLNLITGYIAEATPTPEPATMLLFGSGLVGMGVIGRKKFRKKS